MSKPKITAKRRRYKKIYLLTNLQVYFFLYFLLQGIIFFIFQITAHIETTLRQGGVIGLWASPIANKRVPKPPGPPLMRHTGLGKLGGLINTAVHATKRSPGK